MEKELEDLFVPYKQALQLKELEFDKPCLIESTHKKICVEHEKPGGCQLPNVHCGYPDCTIDESITPIGLPTYEQAFAWLYEKLEIERGTMPLEYNDKVYLLDELIKTVKS